MIVYGSDRRSDFGKNNLARYQPINIKKIF